MNSGIVAVAFVYMFPTFSLGMLWGGSRFMLKQVANSMKNSF